MPSPCAYCGTNGKMTKEHIWPSAIIEKWDDDLLTYNKSTNKLFTGDPVVRDVCETCNNIKLGVLDTHLSQLFDRYFKTYVHRGDKADFEYSYDLLLRSLLKISYNSSRTQKASSPAVIAHRLHASYILGMGDRPKGISIRLLIVTPSLIVSDLPEERREFFPDALRCCDIGYTPSRKPSMIVRLVAFRSYWFYLLIPLKKVTQGEREEFLAGFKQWCLQAGVAVSPEHTSVTIPVEKTTYMDLRLAMTFAGAQRQKPRRN